MRAACPPHATGRHIGSVYRRATVEPALLPLHARGLVFRTNGGALIDSLDLAITHAGITVIMGANGAGKSLLLRLLHGLVLPTQGVIEVAGEPLAEHHRQRQAMVFQKPVLLRRSVMANIEFVRRARPDSVCRSAESLLEHVGLADRARQPARLLSGGEQQRLALARALAVEPALLFLDEPTASLDPASTHKIEQLVRQANTQGTKIVFVTHDIGQARRLADDVVFMDRGSVAEHTVAGRFFTAPCSQAGTDYLAGKLVY